MKKSIFILLTLCLCSCLCLPIFARGTYGACTYDEDIINFSEYTDGADNAFDGKQSTAFAGSVTGKFQGKAVVSGVTVRAKDEIKNLKIYGSENGDEWIELYSEKKIRKLSVFGSTNNGTYSDEILDSMYTYAFTYLRLEIEYGSIAEITMYGYEVDVRGSISALDEDYALGGFDCTMVYSDMPADDQQEFNAKKCANLVGHVLGSKENGAAIVKGTTDEFAYFTVKLKEPSRLTEIAFCHLYDDRNMIRWNNLVFEGSVDGENFEAIGILPPDFSYMNNLKARTMAFLPIEADKEYSYVRMSVPKGGMSISAVDFYIEAQMPDIDTAKVLNAWEGDPYIAVKQEQASAEAPTETTQVTEESGGCKSSIAGGAVVLLSACTCAVFVRKKRKF